MTVVFFIFLKCNGFNFEPSVQSTVIQKQIRKYNMNGRSTHNYVDGKGDLSICFLLPQHRHTHTHTHTHTPHSHSVLVLPSKERRKEKIINIHQKIIERERVVARSTPRHKSSDDHTLPIDLKNHSDLISFLHQIICVTVSAGLSHS